MSLPDTLNIISQQLNIYVGSVMFVFGTLGAVWNILIFRHKSLRSSSYCTYMFVSSLASLCQLIFILSTRILAEGFKIDWTLSRVEWCKLRSYIAMCSSLTALSCFVWAAIDRLFSTCREVKWRRLTSVRVAKRVCISTVFVWLFTSIPTLVFMDINGVSSTTRTCSSYGIFPWFFMALFGLLTLKKIRLMRRRRVGPLPMMILSRMAKIDEQLTFTLFVQIIICMISSIPFCTQTIYASITKSISKSELRLAQENLFLQICRLAFYLNYTSMFYVNILASRTFRKLTRRVLISLCCQKADIPDQLTVTYRPRGSKAKKQQKQKIFVIKTLNSTSRM